MWLGGLTTELLHPSRARYRIVAAGVRAAIASGDLPVGSRLPSQRELARLLSIGRTTVVAAYKLLRGESLLVMRQGAGTWVTRRPAPQPPEVIEPGHDAWVVGDEAVVGFEFDSRTAEEYAKG